MKCNKCLKIIPQGEEIRFWGKRYDSSRRYGGCYCETCWKESDFYHYFENQNQPKSSNSGGFPSWGWFLLGMLFGVLATAIIWFCRWHLKDRD